MIRRWETLAAVGVVCAIAVGLGRLGGCLGDNKPPGDDTSYLGAQRRSGGDVAATRPIVAGTGSLGSEAAFDAFLKGRGAVQTRRQDFRGGEMVQYTVDVGSAQVNVSLWTEADGMVSKAEAVRFMDGGSTREGVSAAVGLQVDFLRRCEGWSASTEAAFEAAGRKLARRWSRGDVDSIEDSIMGQGLQVEMSYWWMEGVTVNGIFVTAFR